MKSPVRPLWMATIVLYALLLLIVSKPLAFFVIALYGGFLYVLLGDIDRVLILSYMALLPICVGKFFPIDLVSVQALHLSGATTGIAADITITPGDVLVAIMMIRMTLDGQAGRFFRRMDRLGWILFVLPVAFMVSSIAGSLTPPISLLHALFYWEPFTVYMFVGTLKRRPDYRWILAVVLAALSGASVIALGEWVMGKTLGIGVEPFPGFIPYDISTDAGKLARFGGTFMYANTLAHYLIWAIFISVPAVARVEFGLQKRAMAALFIAGLALVTSLSRSAWFAIVIGFIGLWYLVRQWKLRWTMAPRIRHAGMILVAVFFIFWVVVGSSRIASTVRTFAPYGSGLTRILLFKQTWPFIESHPLFGVGLAMDTYAFWLNSQRTHIPLVTYFPDAVQNGIVQLLMQVGLVGVTAYLWGWVLAVGWLIQIPADRRWFAAGILLGFVAMVVNAQLQPLLPDMTQFILLTSLLSSSGQMPLPRTGRMHG